ncbi:MAG: hypothetical protein U5K56_09105 [Halioglobus sp.]|nr:hypothetical protein [Halioglobus sp.]
MQVALRLSLSLLCVMAWAVMADEAARDDVPGTERYYVADITLESEEELRGLLERAEQLLLAGVTLPRDRATVTFVLHGPVLRNLLRDDYLDNKRLVDLAARLSALQVIEVKACRAWMGSHGIDEAELLPFIETVALGPALVRELVRERDYVRF